MTRTIKARLEALEQGSSDRPHVVIEQDEANPALWINPDDERLTWDQVIDRYPGYDIIRIITVDGSDHHD
jgi:hypothetical protein